MANDCCAACCALYSVFGIVLLLLFGGMFSQGAITLRLISIKNDWDMDQKSSACFKAAIFYGLTLALSVFSSLYSSRAKKQTL
jgi:hypothetical protein